MRVGLLVTCLVDLIRPRIGFAALTLLESAGYDVHVPHSQTCCGQPGVNSGDRASARALAEKLIEEFEDFDYVVAPSGSCAGMVKTHYPDLFPGEGAWLARVEALAALKGAADFEPLAVAFKRVGNIIKGGVEQEVQADLFEADCETALADVIGLARQTVADQVAQGDYAAALQTLARLREPVDAFFDGVMVMADNPAVRANRLALLAALSRLFGETADLSRLPG